MLTFSSHIPAQVQAFYVNEFKFFGENFTDVANSAQYHESLNPITQEFELIMSINEEQFVFFKDEGPSMTRKMWYNLCKKSAQKEEQFNSIMAL